MKKLPFKQHIADLAFLLKQHGIAHVVICPGSRNAPLIQVFQRDSDFSCHSIVDERSAGYLALGIARQSGEAVAIVTTSGTAALNLAPAVAEAYFQQIPLVVLTADRPPEWPPQFGNQRINQEDIFKPNIKGSYNLPTEPLSEDDEVQVTEQASAIIGTALTDRKGPVHLNVPLNEPLYETVAGASDAVKKMPSPKVTGIESDADTPSLPKAQSRIISSALTDQKKILLIAGMKAYSAEEKKVLNSLVAHYQVTLIAENITNLAADALVTHPGQGPKDSPNANNATTSDLPGAVSEAGPATAGQLISLPELVLASADEGELKVLKPELVVTFGGQVVSKRMRLFVQGLVNVPLIVTGQPPLTLFRELLTSSSLQHPKETGIEQLSRITILKQKAADGKLPSPSPQPPAENRYLSRWKTQEAKALQLANKFFTTAAFSNLTATSTILDQLPAGTTLHLGNSGTIRYAQLKPTRSDLKYFSNRGTSGIDGSLSAAVGAAMVSSGLHVAILGDLSLVYDSNALWNKNFPKNLKIIVLNDQGGGIFRLLDGPSHMPFFEEFSVANHPVDLQHLAEAFGLKHLYASDIAQLQTALARLFSEQTGQTLLEVNTAKSENSAIFKQFFKSLQNQHHE